MVSRLKLEFNYLLIITKFVKENIFKTMSCTLCKMFSNKQKIFIYILKKIMYKLLPS